MGEDDLTVVDISQTKTRGRIKKDYWFRNWKTEKRDKIHRLVSRFHAGDDSAIPELRAKGIRASRIKLSEEEKNAVPERRD